MPGIRETAVHRSLSDGTTVRKRRARHDDHDAVLRLYEEIRVHLYWATSPRDLRLRFFTNSGASAEAGRRPRSRAGPSGLSRAGRRTCRGSTGLTRGRRERGMASWPVRPTVRDRSAHPGSLSAPPAPRLAAPP
ncbi:hypothetical protein GCM10010306_026400 [Streptomyces umbrinus]|nr:hypothetical protein GCM10010306_026400 [Streptomyces umbrinus]